MKHVLVVAHSRTGSTKRLTDAVAAGLTDPEIGDVEATVLSPLAAVADDVRRADAIVLGTPENFGYMSGALKDFFDRVYTPLTGGFGLPDDPPSRGETRGLPYALFVKAGSDGTGAIRSVERIVRGLEWKAVLPPLLVAGPLGNAHLAAARELGMTVAAGLTAGLW